VVSFVPRQRALGTYWIGFWVGPRAGVEAVEKRRTSCTHQESGNYSVLAILVPVQLRI
jgi:hypothetical protein